jgi:hypothetical protein
MHRVERTSPLVRIALLLIVAGALPAQREAFGSPARRMARRGVVVVPAPGPVVVGPRGRVRAMPFMVVPVPLPGGPAAVPPGEPPAVRVAPPAQVSSAPVPAAPATKPAPTVAKPPAAAPANVEEIPAPAPVGLGRPQAGAELAAADRADETAAFSQSWYASHPDAWQPPQPLDVWATTDSAGLDAWLSRSVRTTAGAAADATTVTTAGADSVASDGTRSVLVLPAGHDNPATGAGPDWLPLGVFSVVAAGDSRSHSHQQLAVDRDARISGTFYDALSDTVQPITGAIDRDTRTASWTVGRSGSRFEAPLEAFTNPPRTVAITSGGITTRTWKLMPVAKP